jgi:aquaglyceroporin related protein
MSDEKPLVLPAEKPAGSPTKASLPSPTVSHDENIDPIKTTNLEGSSSGSEDAYAEHGPGIDHKIPQEDVKEAKPDLWWGRTRHILREPLSEFFGVFILILFGDG